MFKIKLLQYPFFYVIILCLLFLCVEIIIKPIGDFPLNDEWLYAKMVSVYHNNQVMDVSKWGYTSMLTHILYGNIFVSFFGYSYFVLHISTLPLSLLGIIYYYYLLYDFVVKNPFHAFLLSLLLLVNPLYISLSNSFMTDVPFICTVILGLYYYLKYKKSNKKFFLIFSSLFFVWSILVRQLGFAFVFGIFISEIITDRRNFFSGLILMGISVSCLFAFEYWLSFTKQSNGYAYLFLGNSSNLNLEVIVATIINFSKRWIHYISFTGFVLFPLLITKFILFIRNKEFFNRKFILIITVIFFIPVVWSMRKFPIGNYFYNTGIGAETLYDTYILQLNTQHSNSIIFYIIKAVSFFGAFTLLFVLVSYGVKIIKNRIELKRTNYALLVISIVLFFYYLFLSLASPIFDRYIIVFSILIVPLVFYDSYILFNKLYVILTSLLLLFSVLASKDYFEGHRTRWEAINFLKINYHITDEKINGGLEHESTVFFERNDWFNKWKNIPKNDYVISYGGIDGYNKFNSFVYQRYIPFKIDTVFILKINDSK